MAEKTAGEIFDEMKNAQQALIKANLEKYKTQQDKSAAQVEANAAAESAGGSADYQNYINPNNSGGGIGADAASRLGLNKGKLSETNQSGGYNAYQSRLAAAAEAAKKSQEQLELSAKMAQTKAKSDISNVGANEQSMRSSNYWKQANWDYQLAADKKAEEEAKKAEEEARRAEEAARRSAVTYTTDDTPTMKGKYAGGIGDKVGSGSAGNDENSTSDVSLQQRGDFTVEYSLIRNAVKKATKNGTQQASEADRERILNSAWASGWFKKSDLYDLEKELGWG